MTRRVTISPTNIYGQTPLDMRISAAVGRDLAEEINHSVVMSQKFIQTTLPDLLIVTQKQFVSLQTFTEEMYHTTDRMYVVKDGAGEIVCVMEVEIDRDIDIVPWVEDIIRDTEDDGQPYDPHPGYANDEQQFKLKLIERQDEK